jgi:hypothetical protein
MIRRLDARELGAGHGLAGATLKVVKLIDRVVTIFCRYIVLATGIALTVNLTGRVIELDIDDGATLLLEKPVDGGARRRGG